ncbi:MFS general substrate transporter [Artomyces pyxidatus]|uniref:MFS general substrate transporter n=1 Tax=Artomyces pyxidatus TaxID=48021 RepID=A0ACB8T5B5_9AGAM|nr:MFS general substrate transporter [Artomyces pyxidatus]
MPDKAMEAKEYELVVFSPNDPEDPVNWRLRRKLFVTASICILSFCAVFGSSAYAPGQQQLGEEYGVGVVTTSAGLSLYVLGFGTGPLICGPMSELYGRKLPYTLAWPLMIASIAPSAFADNIAVILLFRFFTGCCAACALNNGSGLITDMFHNDIHAQSRAIIWYSFCPLSGPCFGSLVGFFVAAVSQGRALWVVRVHFYFAIAVWPLVFLLPETHGPTVLLYRARALRKEGHATARAPQELHPTSKQQLIQKNILRPTQMLFYEPINQGAAIWISLAYGIIYFFFEAYPVVFIEQHHIPFRLCGLLFIPIPIGMVLVTAPYSQLTRLFARLPLPGIERKDGVLHPAESRLKLVLSACVLLPISLFWFAWTSGPETHWIAPALAGIAFGYSMMAIFMCFLAYVAQIYTIYASSAVACNTFARSIIACIFPVAAHSILDSMGTKWGVSLFGFLSLGLIPIPLIFIRYGEQLRQKSHFAKEAKAILAGLRQKPGLLEEKTQVEQVAEVEVEMDNEKRETGSYV